MKYDVAEFTSIAIRSLKSYNGGKRPTMQLEVVESLPDGHPIHADWGFDFKKHDPDFFTDRLPMFVGVTFANGFLYLTDDGDVDSDNRLYRYMDGVRKDESLANKIILYRMEVPTLTDHGLWEHPPRGAEGYNMVRMTSRFTWEIVGEKAPRRRS